MIVMQVADDDGLDRVGGDAEGSEPVAHRLDHFALAFLAHGLVEAGVDHNRAGRPDDRPNKEIERLQNIVRVAINKIGGRTPRMMTVADGVNFMNVVGHGIIPFRRHGRTWSGHPRLDLSPAFKTRMPPTSAGMTGRMIEGSAPHK